MRRSRVGFVFVGGFAGRRGMQRACPVAGVGGRGLVDAVRRGQFQCIAHPVRPALAAGRNGVSSMRTSPGVTGSKARRTGKCCGNSSRHMRRRIWSGRVFNWPEWATTRSGGRMQSSWPATAISISPTTTRGKLLRHGAGCGHGLSRELAHPAAPGGCGVSVLAWLHVWVDDKPQRERRRAVSHSVRLRAAKPGCRGCRYEGLQLYFFKCEVPCLGSSDVRCCLLYFLVRLFASSGRPPLAAPKICPLLLSSIEARQSCPAV